MRKPSPTANRNHVVPVLAVFLATGFYSSYLPAQMAFYFRSKIKGHDTSSLKWTGAGIVGSLFGVLTCWLLPASVSSSPIVLLGVIFFAVACSGVAEKALNQHDDPRIIIDEWVGIWVTFFGFSVDINGFLLVGFVLFRILDVWKGPWGQRLQRLPGGFGIVLDDVVAGVIANVLLRLLSFSWTLLSIVR